MISAEEEFDCFVRARTHALLRSAYLLTGDQQHAEDLVQSALAKTHQSWKRLADTGNAEAYARRTMYHLQVSWWRRRKPPASPRSDPPGPAVPDRLIYLDHKELQRLNADGTTDPLFEARTESCGLVVSPDRGHVAYVVSDGGGATGDLIVGRGLTGESPKTILRNVSCMGGTSPVWAGRSGKLVVKQGNAGRRVTVDVTGRIGATPFTNVQGYLAFSPNGQHVAYRDQNGQIVVAGPDGALERSFDHKDESPTGGFSVQGVSDDGKRVVVGLLNTDPDIVRTGFRLVDAQTGRDIDLPPAVTGPNPKAADITFMSGQRPAAAGERQAAPAHPRRRRDPRHPHRTGRPERRPAPRLVLIRR